MRGKSPQNSTILSRVIDGFFECSSLTDSIIDDTLFETFGARPFVPIKHISAFDFVYHPTPKKFDPFLFFFT